MNLYDRLNDLIETRLEVDSTRSLNARYRYDRNQNRVMTIYPEGNAESAIYDERDLLFKSTRGADSRPVAGLFAASDPTSFDRPGGAGTVASTITNNYDRNRNLTEMVDAANTDSTNSNNSKIAGVGDVTKIAYDGFDRRKAVTDPDGNKTVYTYDPDDNVVRVIKDGDPINDGVGATENKTLEVTEYIHDELSRLI